MTGTRVARPSPSFLLNRSLVGRLGCIALQREFVNHSNEFGADSDFGDFDEEVAELVAVVVLDEELVRSGWAGRVGLADVGLACEYHGLVQQLHVELLEGRGQWVVDLLHRTRTPLL